MKRINKTQIYKYSAKQMFNIIKNYESYPEFIKSCKSAKTQILKPNHLLASLHIGNSIVSVDFSSYLDLIDNELISIKLHDGPFKELNGFWKFTSIDDNSCKVELEINYTFNFVMEFVIGNVFENEMVALFNKFQDRAEKIYP